MKERRGMRCGTPMLALAAMLLALASSPSLAGSGKDATPSGRYHVVGPQRPLAPGERVELKLVPSPPEGTRIDWGCSLVGVPPPASQSGIGRGPTVSYVAPFVVRERAIVRVTAGITGDGLRDLASIELDLLAGNLDVAADCLGPNQAFLEDRGGLDPDYTYVEELPEAIRRVQAVTPKGALARGAQATVMVNALVCRTGRVIAAVDVARGGRLPDPQPLPVDQRLVEAAIQAVLQWEFRPGRAAGEPIATWVAVPFRFGP